MSLNLPKKEDYSSKKNKKYHGNMIIIPIRSDYNDEVAYTLELTLATDDGTWGDHVIIRKLGEPSAQVITTIGENGLWNLIWGLANLYEDAGYDTEQLGNFLKTR